ncbi:hypothetical protein KKE60_04605 [Patescibacteria group bacterium]|nr:hypothetical protein [Patescibacteria group bacterium]
MPRELCRYELTIIDVREEPIQAITPEDCKAEGIGYVSILMPLLLGLGMETEAFQVHWDEIYPGSWERNDVVVRIEFVLAKEEGTND